MHDEDQRVHSSRLMNISNREWLSLGTIVIIRVCRISEDSQGANKNRVRSCGNSCAIVKDTVEGSAPGIGSRLVDRRCAGNSTKGLYTKDGSSVGVSAECRVRGDEICADQR